MSGHGEGRLDPATEQSTLERVRVGGGGAVGGIGAGEREGEEGQYDGRRIEGAVEVQKSMLEAAIKGSEGLEQLRKAFFL